MLRRYSWLLLLCCISSLAAQEKLLPPSITKEQAAEGWIALFDGETTYGWKAEGPVAVKDGYLVVGGAEATTLTSTSQFITYEIDIQSRPLSDSYDYTMNYGGVNSHSKGSEKITNGSNKTKVTDGSKATPIVIKTQPGTVLEIKSINLLPTGGKSLFNGKDLSGWKAVPDKKSKFSVTSKGELNVLDGAGDLQTTEEFDDFCLQLDVISLGDHLNSGVFFRCLPGEFWSGYEAQVRNEWQTTVTMKDGKSYTGSATDKGDTVEVKVGRDTKKLSKSDIEKVVDHRNKPIDTGSGGIYHFCPARKVVSSDREYYTMTVIAHGNHMAVWVNGYQTAEHIDTRPFNKSARKGRKDDKGPFSIQGHDPTTNLSFKNIRVNSYPK
jgi:hypothetical protein